MGIFSVVQSARHCYKTINAEHQRPTPTLVVCNGWIVTLDVIPLGKVREFLISWLCLASYWCLYVWSSLIEDS